MLICNVAWNPKLPTRSVGSLSALNPITVWIPMQAVLPYGELHDKHRDQTTVTDAMAAAARPSPSDLSILGKRNRQTAAFSRCHRRNDALQPAASGALRHRHHSGAA